MGFRTASPITPPTTIPAALMAGPIMRNEGCISPFLAIAPILALTFLFAIGNCQHRFSMA
jgi:hypothetical protein